MTKQILRTDKFLIRENKGQYYVYLIEKDSKNQIRYNYVGPLVKIIDFYVNNGGVGDVPPQCDRRDLNPGHGLERPTEGDYPLQPQITNYDKLKGVVQNNHNPRADNNLQNLPNEVELLGFFQWCKKQISEETCKRYVNYLKKPVGKSKNSIKAWKKYYRYKGLDELADKLKIPKSQGVDLYVPSKEEIAAAISKVKGTKYELFYKLLVESGIRETEALKILKEYNEANDKKEEGFYVYILNWTRGSKKSFYAFHISELQRIEITKTAVDKLVQKNNIVAPKYVRKFVSTKLVSLGISPEVVDFIQGRTPRSILSKHYLNLYALAKESYKKYVEWLKEFYTTVYKQNN